MNATSPFLAVDTAGKGIAPPDKPNAEQQKDAAKLEKLSAGAFDRAYMDQMVVDHKKTIARFEGEAKSGKDPELKAFAAKTLPTLTDHLKMAEQTRSASRGTGGGAATASR
jgi:putative membrane protein